MAVNLSFDKIDPFHVEVLNIKILCMQTTFLDAAFAHC